MNTTSVDAVYLKEKQNIKSGQNLQSSCHSIKVTMVCSGSSAYTDTTYSGCMYTARYGTNELTEGILQFIARLYDKTI